MVHARVLLSGLLGLAAIFTLAPAPIAGQATDPGEKAPMEKNPSAGEIPTTLRAHVLVDKRTDAKNPRNREKKLHCFTLEHGLYPVVAVFARSVPKDKDAPLARVVGALHTLASDERVKAENFGTFVTFLALDKEFHKDDKRDVVGDEILAFSKALEPTLKPANQPLAVPMALTAKESEPTKAWGLAEKDIVVVFYHRLKEIKRWEFEAGHPEAAEVDAVVAFIKQYMKL